MWSNHKQPSRNSDLALAPTTAAKAPGRSRLARLGTGHGPSLAPARSAPVNEPIEGVFREIIQRKIELTGPFSYSYQIGDNIEAKAKELMTRLDEACDAGLLERQPSTVYGPAYQKYLPCDPTTWREGKPATTDESERAFFLVLDPNADRKKYPAAQYNHFYFILFNPERAGMTEEQIMSGFESVVFGFDKQTPEGTGTGASGPARSNFHLNDAQHAIAKEYFRRVTKPELEHDYYDASSLSVNEEGDKQVLTLDYAIHGAYAEYACVATLDKAGALTFQLITYPLEPHAIEYNQKRLKEIKEGKR